MTERTVYDATTGEILWRFQGSEAGAALQASDGRALLLGAHDGATHYVADGAVTPRPATGLPAAHSLPVGTDWPVADVPEGTEVWTGREGEAPALAGIVDGDGLVLSFPEPGLWRVSLAPPWPWRPATCDVGVSDED